MVRIYRYVCAHLFFLSVTHLHSQIHRVGITLTLTLHIHIHIFNSHTHIFG